jgi:hypothetical protein
MHDFANHLEGLVTEFVILNCGRAAIEHCHSAAMVRLLRYSDPTTILNDAAPLAIVWRRADRTRQRSGMGVGFQDLAATAGVSSPCRAIGSNGSESFSDYSGFVRSAMTNCS